MNKFRPIFPQLGGFAHGGDYNPEQWLDRPDILKKDIELMKEAHVNVVTLGVFSWSMYEPREGEYHFDWLEEIMNNLYASGIHTILATPSGARPAWLDKQYPECMRVDAYDHREHHGMRHNHCMTSPVYREKVKNIDSRLAERFAKHPGLLMWHISNEFGGECYCPHCVANFRKYLAERYDNDIEKLNHAWWTIFWSHRFTDFDQIDPPYETGESCVLGLTLDWKRFTTRSTCDFMKAEIETLRKYNRDIPVTTNFMEIYDGLDYQVLAKEVDYVSWDSYPLMHNDYESIEDTFLRTAFCNAQFRSMKKDRPFILMESAPGLVNWHGVNKLKRPGYGKLMSLQAVASGSDTVQYFQWRKSRGSSEQFHGAVVDHIGTNDTRIFREVADTGRTLKEIAEVCGSVQKNEVAVIWDWDNRWAIDDARALSNDSKKYEDTVIGIWKELMRMGVEADVISQDMDFDDYKVIVAPMMYLLHEGVGERLTKFVNKGGQLVASYFTGYVDESTLAYLGGFPGQNLKELFGVIAEEIDSLYPSEKNYIINSYGGRYEVRDYQEYLRVNGADVLATYEGDYLEGRAAVTRKESGRGAAFYVGCRLDSKDMRWILDKALASAAVELTPLPEGIEHHVRYSDEYRYDFYLNVTKEAKDVPCSLCEDFIASKTFAGSFVLQPVEATVVKRKLTK